MAAAEAVATRGAPGVTDLDQDASSTGGTRAIAGSGHHHGAAIDGAGRDDGVRCTYVRYEDVEGTFFSTPSSSGSLAEGTLCWVLKSKGGGGKKELGRYGGELFLRARVVSDPAPAPASAGPTDPSDVDPPSASPPSSPSSSVDRRVLVRYPLGSTYRVRRRNLLPVLEPGEGEGAAAIVVIATSETSDYRRCAAVHVCPGESFLEIGCAFGTTVDRVRRCLTEYDGGLPPLQKHAGEDGGGNSTPSSSGVGAAEREGGTKDRAVAMGVDKSIDCIAVARSRHPRCQFRHLDVFTDEGFAELKATCRDELSGGRPDVVAIDIGGNRGLPAVIDCVRLVTGAGGGDDDEDDDDDGGVRSASTGTPPPRLVIVKSRALHAVTSDVVFRLIFENVGLAAVKLVDNPI